MTLQMGASLVQMAGDIMSQPKSSTVDDAKPKMQPDSKGFLTHGRGHHTIAAKELPVRSSRAHSPFRGRQARMVGIQLQDGAHHG